MVHFDLVHIKATGATVESSGGDATSRPVPMQDGDQFIILDGGFESFRTCRNN